MSGGVYNFLTKNKDVGQGYVDRIAKQFAEEEDATIMAESFTERGESVVFCASNNNVTGGSPALPEDKMTSSEVQAALNQAKLLGSSNDSITFSRHSRPLLEKYYLRAIKDLHEDFKTHLEDEEEGVEKQQRHPGAESLASSRFAPDERGEEKIAHTHQGMKRTSFDESQTEVIDNSFGSSIFLQSSTTGSPVKDRKQTKDRRAEWYSSKHSSKSSRRSKFSIGTATSRGSTRMIIGASNHTKDFSLDNTWEGGVVDESIRIVGLKGGGHASISHPPPIDSLDLFLGGDGASCNDSTVSAFGHESLSAIGFMQNHVAGDSDGDSSTGVNNDSPDQAGVNPSNSFETTDRTDDDAHVAGSASTSKASKRPSAESGNLSRRSSTRRRRTRISTSSTIHMRSGLEIMLKQRLEQARMATSMSTLGVGDTYGGISRIVSYGPTDDLPFELEPDDEELERRRQFQSKRLQSISKGSLMPPAAPIHESLTGQQPRTINEEEDLESSPTSSRTRSASNSPPDLFIPVFEVAKEQYVKDFAKSFIPDNTTKFPCFDLNEIVQGLILGKGSFAQVIEVKGFCLNPMYENDTNEAPLQGLDSSKTKNNRDCDSGAFFSQSMHCRRHELADSAMELSFDFDSEDENCLEGVETEAWTSGNRIESSNEGLQRRENNIFQRATRNSLNDLERLGYGDITDDDDDEFRVVEHDSDDDSVIIRKDVLLSQSPKTGSSRRFLAEHCYRAQNTKITKKHILERKNSRLGVGRGKKRNTKSEKVVPRFALKQLKKRVTDEPHALLQGIADMATEARVLSSMVHPNIVKLRGVARGQNVPFQRDYFILLDRLYDTLEARIKKWKAKDTKLQGGRGLVVDFNQTRRRQLWRERVGFIGDFASALAYIHERHIIHRDLKPDNLGFDIRGDIKLFDFGLAKEIPTIRNTAETLYNFTSMCGSPRYMAPEVGTEEAYNELCDVYSFGIVAWEMMVMEKPFGDVHMVGLLSEVWVDNENARRPSPSLIQVGSFMKNRSIKRMLSRTLSRRDSEELNTPDLGTPASLQALLDDCWANDLARRPSMVEVVDRMKEEIKAMNNASNSNIATASDQASLTTKTSSSDICDGRVREGTAATASS